MDAMDAARLVDAMTFALEAHGHQKRKGKEVPYASHLMQVAGLVLEYGGDLDQAVAGFLHDVLEDCEGVTLAQLRERFGATVADIVERCSDLLEEDTPDKKSDWEARKRRYVDDLRSSDLASRLVIACDKLHNLMNLLADLRAHGAETLARFSAPPPRILWYYEEVRRALGEDLPRGLLLELDIHLGTLRIQVDQAWQPERES